MSNNNNRRLGEAPCFHVILSTGLGTGFLPWMPGTWGALLALAVWYGLYLTLPVDIILPVTGMLIVCNFIVGVWTSNIMERYWGQDPRTVNIDEFIGVWIPCLVALCGDNTLLMAFLGFALFRIIDIFKPLGCRWIDRNVRGGWGVMLDDVLAGVYALIILYGIKFIML